LIPRHGFYSKLVSGTCVLCNHVGASRRDRYVIGWHLSLTGLRLDALVWLAIAATLQGRTA
jgi:hypothetical protein